MALDKDKDHKQGLQLLACLSQQANSSGELFAYVQQVAHFLQGKLAWRTDELNSLVEIAESSSPRYDLLLFNETGWHSLTRPYFQTAVSLPRVKPSILLIREPRWPLQRLLLILRGEATDKATIEWGLKLTKHNNCMVTLLVVRPSSEAQKDQFGLLKANTIAGRHLRTALQQFVTHQINGVLKVSHGSPEYIIQQEVAGTAYDLIVLGSEPECRLFYWRLDSLLDPLLQWTKQSILIAKPIYLETIQQKNHLVDLQG